MCNNNGPAPCMGAALIVIAIFNLGLLPVSIPTMCLGCALCGCCCQTSIKSLAISCIVLNGIFLAIQLIVGVIMFASMDSICAGLLKMDETYYLEEMKGSYLLEAGCEICKAFPAFCEDGAAFACVLCVDGLLGIYAGMFIAGSLVLELPAMILSIVVCKDKKMQGAAPAGSGASV